MNLDQRLDELRRGDRGHFAAHLADAWDYADSRNKARLRAAFPEFFAEGCDLLQSCGALPERRVRVTYRNGKLACDMEETCNQPVTHIDSKGFVYCAEHGQARQRWGRCRKLRPHELRRLERGEPIKRY